MTDLLHTIPDFPIKHYTHLLPSLERSLVTVTDLLTLDALDLAKKAQLPLLDVRRLKEHVLATLQRQLGLENELSDKFEGQLEGAPQFGELKTDGNGIVQDRGVISTLDQSLDGALDGGIQTGYVTDITGERYSTCTKLLKPLAMLSTTIVEQGRHSSFSLSFYLHSSLPHMGSIARHVTSQPNTHSPPIAWIRF